MKKILLTISAIGLFIFGANAQSPDLNFEFWNTVPFGSIQDPQGWASLNALVSFGGVQSVFKETTTPFSGTASAKITTVKVTGALIPNPYLPGHNLDTAGLLVVGKINISPAGIKYGFTYAWRPAVLSFQSKYTPVAGDSAFLLVCLTKWNVNHRDTIATGKYATGTSTSTYSLNSLNMSYKPAFAAVMPDSEQIFISSSVYSHPGAKVGSAFYIDELAWSGYISTNDIKGAINNVSVFPNPANDNINLSCPVDVSIIEITDITGRLAGSYSMTDNKINIQTSAYAPGMYLFTLLNTKKEVVNRGKFEIAK